MTEDERAELVEEVRYELAEAVTSLARRSRDIATTMTGVAALTALAREHGAEAAETHTGVPAETVKVLEHAFGDAYHVEAEMTGLLAAFGRVQSALSTWNAIKVGAPAQFIRWDREEER